MGKIIAIAFSDLHVHKFRNFNENNSRLLYSLSALGTIASACRQHKVPALFSGDLLHTPKEIENETNTLLHKQYAEYFERTNIDFYAISGNHDLSEKSSYGHRSPSHLDVFSSNYHTFNLLDGKPFGANIGSNATGMLVQGIQYMNNDKDLAMSIEDYRRVAKQSGAHLKVLLLHSDMPGAKTPEGMVLDSNEHIPRNLDTFFKEWDLVLCGHIHRPMALSRKCYMLGSPLHQTAGDVGIDMGYWEVWATGEMHFVPLDLPQFKRLKEGEIPPDNRHYYLQPEVVLEDEEIVSGEFNINKSRKRLAKSYLKTKGIKDKAKARALINILNSAE